MKRVETSRRSPTQLEYYSCYFPETFLKSAKRRDLHMGRQRTLAPVLLSVGMCLLLYVAMPVSGTADGGRVALESTKERIARLEDEAKAKTIEARIRQTAAQLENEHAEQEKSASVADQSRKGAIDDKHEAEDDFAKAKELSSSSVREEQEARLERHRAQSAEKVLSLKTRVASLLKSRAQDEDRRASTAQQEVNKVKSRVQAVRDEIARLERQAKIKRFDTLLLLLVAKCRLGFVAVLWWQLLPDLGTTFF